MIAQGNIGQLPTGQIGFGAMRITGRGIWGPPRDEGEAIALLRRAVEKGVSFIDTADSYGPSVSETLVAKALHPYPAGLVVATKGGLLRPGPDRWVTDCRPEHLRRACADSLKRLKLECIESISYMRSIIGYRSRIPSARSSAFSVTGRSAISASRTSPRGSSGERALSPRSCLSRTITISGTDPPIFLSICAPKLVSSLFRGTRWQRAGWQARAPRWPASPRATAQRRARSR